ncbi:hypothetical protein MnTg02_01975 [bacterium MnTg02]|nr:hypothetical protein MnTg02_01975 [bacterium MnTg02]
MRVCSEIHCSARADIISGMTVVGWVRRQKNSPFPPQSSWGSAPAGFPGGNDINPGWRWGLGRCCIPTQMFHPPPDPMQRTFPRTIRGTRRRSSGSARQLPRSTQSVSKVLCLLRQSPFCGRWSHRGLAAGHVFVAATSRKVQMAAASERLQKKNQKR